MSNNYTPEYSFTRPTPSDRELSWDKTKQLVVKTDKQGNVLFVNDDFVDICGYDEVELINNPINMLRHPDTPQTIFKLMWDDLNFKKGAHVVVKNMAKTGRYFWTFLEINANVAKDGVITYTGHLTGVPDDAIKDKIAPLYERLIRLEKESGLEAATNYMVGFLEEKDKSLIDLTDSLVVRNAKTVSKANLKDGSQKRKGFFSSMFKDEDEE